MVPNLVQLLSNRVYMGSSLDAFEFVEKQSPEDCYFKWLSGKESTCQCRRHRRLWFDPLGRTPGGGNDNLLQYICLGNHMDRGAWLAMTVYGVAKNWTQLSTHARNSQRSLVITLTLMLRNLSTFLRSTPVIIMWFVLTLRIDLIKKTDTYTTYCNIKYTKISIV